MGITFNPKAVDKARQRKSAHQIRRKERFIEESQKVHDDNFGQRKEFGKRTVKETSEAKPRRTFGVFKSKS